MLPSLYVGDYLFVAKWPYGYSRFSFPLGIPIFDGRFLSALPNRGDVVVFRHPTENADLIKRVIGLPGDIVEVREGQVILNGRAVHRRALNDSKVIISPNSPCRTAPGASERTTSIDGRSACVYHAFLETLPGGPSYTILSQTQNGPADEFTATKVPPGHLFLMGDNRDDSLDSRFSTLDGGVGMLPLKDLVGRAWFTFWSTDGSASYGEPWTWVTALRSHRLGSRYTGASQ